MGPGTSNKSKSHPSASQPHGPPPSAPSLPATPKESYILSLFHFQSNTIPLKKKLTRGATPLPPPQKKYPEDDSTLPWLPALEVWPLSTHLATVMPPQMNSSSIPPPASVSSIPISQAAGSRLWPLLTFTPTTIWSPVFTLLPPRQFPILSSRPPPHPAVLPKELQPTPSNALTLQDPAEMASVWASSSSRLGGTSSMLPKHEISCSLTLAPSPMGQWTLVGEGRSEVSW